MRSIEWSAGQAYNFRELSHPQIDPNTGVTLPPNPFTRFYSTLELNLGKLLSSNTYYWYPYAAWRNQISTSWTYVFERALHQRILSFDRSLTLGYSYDKHTCSGNDTACGTSDLLTQLNYSISDYFMPQAGLEYNFISHQFLAARGTLLFQSPSQCWRFALNGHYDISIHATLFDFDLSLNLSGGGFGGVSEVASQAMAH